MARLPRAALARVVDPRTFIQDNYTPYLGDASLRIALTPVREHHVGSRPIWRPSRPRRATRRSAVAAFTAGLNGVERVEVLPFHQLGAAKWAELGLRYQLADVDPPSPELVRRVEDQFRTHGLTVV